MKMESIWDESFAAYGRAVTGYDTAPLLQEMRQQEIPKGVVYVPSVPRWEQLGIFQTLRNRAYGGLPIQLGCCSGNNTKLNCLEYHRDSEFNIGTEDFILLLAQRSEIREGKLDTASVRAFLCPADTLIEVFATTLHYAPCSSKAGEGFRVAVILPRGTNEPKPAIIPADPEDQLLWAANKWLLAHEASAEAAQGAVIALTGENIDISAEIAG